MHKDAKRPSSTNPSPKRDLDQRTFCGLWTVEALEPRLLLSANPIDPVRNQDDFAEFLGSAGLNGLGELGISVTLDVPVGFTSASSPEQVAAIGEAGLVAVGTQPQGALSGKIVYVHGGHGYTADNLGNGSWSFQRPNLLNLIEDLSNQDMMTFLVDFLWNAGATVVPLRPVGNQLNEVVLDNDDVEVTFTGAWSNSSSSVFFGSAGDTPYRFASTSVTETAFARYRPNIAEAGFYPIYSWTGSGPNRVNQLYRVTHSGGTTEVTVNHRRVGNGLVYLGTYYFEQGTGGYVDISNRSNESGVVIADMIRFGNGMGDIDRGGGISGVPREDEPALYWIQKHLGQGISPGQYRVSSSDRSATVSASPRWAEFMNREADGSLSDRVFVSFHSNAGAGTSRGTLGLVNGNNDPNTATPNQFLLADTLSAEVNDDLVALNGTFEHNWQNRSIHTLDRSDIEFGEINNLRINNEFDATIIEWAFHDNVMDTDLMRDADVRNAVARATYQGILRYFNVVDGGATPVTFLPDPVTDTKAQTNGDGTVTVSWTPPAVLAIGGGTPTGYMVYTSVNGYGFDGGTFVAGGATTSLVMSGLDSANGTHYFKVVAVNAGGESLASTVVAATPQATPPGSKVLIVNGFDRIDKNTNFRETLPGGSQVDRVRPRFQNSGDYSVQVAEAIEAFNPALGIDTAQNENIISGDVLLSDYDTVVWILGEESSADATFDATEQTLTAAFVAGGGDLFVSGAEIGWDLDNLNNGQLFYNDTLGADYVSDDAGTYNVQGAAGSIFDGLTFAFDDSTLFYDVNFPDVINPLGSAVTALNYVGGTGGGAAIQKKGSVGGDVVMLAFPFETITTAADRAAVLAAAFNFFGAPPSVIPSPPNGLVATAGDNTVSLDWNDNAEPDLLGYDLQRATSPGGPFTALNVTPLLVSQFTDNTAVNGTTYFYRVIAIDTDLNESLPGPVQQATPDDHGDNKNLATVVSTPSTTTGQAGGVADTDWFELNLTGNTDYTFTVLGNGLAAAEVRFYSSGLTLLATDTGPAAGGTLAEISSFVTSGDIYYLEVVGGGGASGGYQLAVQETDDHGDNIASATTIAGSVTLGEIQNFGEPDFFRFTATAGMAYDINVTEFSALGPGVPDATLTLWTPGGAVVLQDSGSTPGGVHAQINWIATSSGDMFISVSAGPGSLGGYLLGLTESVAALAGDLNSDGFVGVDDLNIVLVNWNQNVTPGDLSQGDATGEGFVGVDDLNIVLVNWNNGTPPLATATPTSIPAEPSQPTETAAQTSAPEPTLAPAPASVEPVARTTQEAVAPVKHRKPKHARVSHMARRSHAQPARAAEPAERGMDQRVLQAAWAQASSLKQAGSASHEAPMFGLWEDFDKAGGSE